MQWDVQGTEDIRPCPQLYLIEFVTQHNSHNAKLAWLSLFT